MPDKNTIQDQSTVQASRSRIVNYSQIYDVHRDYVSDSPTSSGFARMLQDIDSGDIGQMMELNLEMESKDSHMHAEAMKRRNSLTALDWEIEPAESKDDQALADDAAAKVREVLDNLDTFDETLEHLATAIGPNLAVTELIWENGELVETNDVPGHRLNQEPYYGPELRVVTDDNIWPGEVLEFGKFLVYTPNSQAGFPWRNTIMRAGAWLYLLKHFAKADWAAFSELYGIPFRTANYDEGLPDGERTTIKKMLRDMSADGWAMFPEGVDVQFHQVAANGSPHQQLIEWIEKKQTILYLGQTLTTDTQGVGSFSLGKVHANVRADLLMSDIKKEARALRMGLIRPICAIAFPNKDVPLPHFRRIIAEEKNIEEARLRLDQITKAQEMRLPFDTEWAYDALDIPKPKPERLQMKDDSDADAGDDVEDNS